MFGTVGSHLANSYQLFFVFVNSDSITIALLFDIPANLFLPGTLRVFMNIQKVPHAQSIASHFDNGYSKTVRKKNTVQLNNTQSMAVNTWCRLQRFEARPGIFNKKITLIKIQRRQRNNLACNN